MILSEQTQRLRLRGPRPRQQRIARSRAIPTQFHEEAELYASLTRQAGSFPLTTSLLSRPLAATPLSKPSTLQILRKMSTSSLASIQNKPRLWGQQSPSAMTRYARGPIAHGSPQIARHSPLRSRTFAPLTAIPSQDSEAGAAFAAKASSLLGEDYEDWKGNLNDAHSIAPSAAEALGQWSATLADDHLSLISGATSTQGSHQRPILIWDARLAVAAASNTGTESRAEAIPGTCVDSTISVAVPQSSSNSEAVRSFQAFLESQLGKNAAAYAGLAYNDGVPEDSQAAWFMKPVK